MTVPPAPADDAADREAVRHDLKPTLFVEAGAGTGKTTALVSRITELVVTGAARIGEVVAITFTEAAAGELRDRVAEALERVALGLDDATPEVTAEGRHRAAQAVADLDGAVMGTLHSFARRILSAYPLEAGMPPWIEVLDEVRSVAAFEERWQGFTAALMGEGGSGDAVLRAFSCGVSLPALRDLARILNENWDLVGERPWPVPPPPPVDLAPVLAALRAAVAARPGCAEPTDRMAQQLDDLARVLAQVEGAGHPLLALETVRTAHCNARGGQKGNWPGGVEPVRALVRALSEARDRLVAEVGEAALRTVLARLAGLTLASAQQRRAEGRVEFHDLLVLARDLLRRRPDVAVALGTQWRYLLIDEFQDTDPIQIELAVRIAAGGAAGARSGVTGAAVPQGWDGDWRELRVRRGQLFFVGDPKQSIYRFRRADVAQFMEARQVLADRVLQLTRNRRSVPGILDWVNAVFESLMGEGEPGIQPAYRPLVAHRPAVPGGPLLPVVRLGGPHELRSDEVRRVEAADVVRAVRAACDEGWPVGDDGRPAELSDIAVLLPTRTGLDILLDGLDDADVPYRLEGTSLVYTVPEVRDLLTVLRAVDDPTDEVAVLASLRSPYLGCGDDDLVRFRRAGGRWDYRRVSAEADPADPVVAGLALLARLHRHRWWGEPSALVDEAMEACRVMELALDGPRPRESWRCLRYLADQARQFSDAGGGDLRRYLSWVDHQRRDDLRTTEATLPEDDHKAVRVMTVHAAKGLEFPVVVLAGLGTRPPGERGHRLLFGPGTVEASLEGAFRTAGFEALDEAAQEHEQAERVRLLYVAATRARDHLVVSLHHNEKTTACHAVSLLAVCGGRADLWRALPAAEDGPADPAAGSPGPDPVGPADDHDPGTDATTLAHWAEERAAVLDRAGEPRAVSATALAARAAGRAHGAEGGAGDGGEPATPAGDGADGAPAGGVPAEDGADGGQQRAPWRRGRAGTAVGRAVHAVLQRVDLDGGGELDARAAAEAAAEGVPGRGAEVARLARAALGAPAVRRAVESGRYWRELYVGAPAGDRVVEGFIDLLVDGPAGLEVVDYKTDRVDDDEALEAALGRYRLQGAAYALAVEAVVGRPVTTCSFVFLRGEEVRERQVPDLAGAVAEVRAVLAAG